jgi:flagellar biosynthesis regulator FlbT
MLRSIAQQCVKTNQRRNLLLQRFICVSTSRELQQQLLLQIQQQQIQQETYPVVQQVQNRRLGTAVSATKSTSTPEQKTTTDTDTTSSPTPTVFDKLVTLMFVDPSGARRTVKAFVGMFVFVFFCFKKK